MRILPIALGMVAGICVYVGLLHLLVGWRRAEKGVHFSFAILCFCIVGVALSSVGLYGAETVVAYGNALRWQQTFIILGLMPLLWFVAFSTGFRPRAFLHCLLAIVVFGLVVNFASPSSLFYASIGGVTSAVTWWGERIAQPVAATTGPWLWLLRGFLLSIITFLGFACAYQYRRGERGAALKLLLGTSIVLAMRVHDQLGLFQGAPGVSLVEYGYLALIVVMSMVLLDDLVRLGIIKQEAEDRVNALNAELERRVIARTADLAAANVQLEQQHQKAERRQKVAESLAGLLDLLNAGRSLEDLWAAIAAEAGQLFHARAAALYDATDGVFTLLAGFGSHPAALADAPVLAQDRLRQAMPTGRAQVINSPVALSQLARASSGALPAVLAVPLSGGSFHGGLVLAADSSCQFADDDAALASAFGDQVALAIENAQLRRQVAAVAVAEERTRLARDLHDSVTQTLYAIAVTVEALPHVWDRHPQEARRALSELHRLAQGALAEMRGLLLELRPAALLERPLGALLRELADALLSRTQMPITITVSGERALPADVQVALYRIVQESLNNIVKHARATEAWVELCCEPSRVALRLRDNGRGFEPLNGSERGFGLRNMRERADAIGAAFALESRPGQGTEIRVTWSGA